MSDALLKFICDAISYELDRPRREREAEERRTFVARFNARMATGDWWRA